MSILDEIRGNEALDTTITVKIGKEYKAEMVAFCEKHRISLGKAVRYGLTMVVKEVKDELDLDK